MKLVGLGDSAAQYLASFATQLATYEIEIPDAVYVAAGEVPWDGESLILSLGSIVSGVPGRAVGTSLLSPSNAISASTLYVELIRKVETWGYEGGRLGIPSEEAQQFEGVRALNDAGAMVKTALVLKGQGIPVQLGVDYAVGPCMPVGPMGGFAAVRLALDISNDGA